MKAIPMTEKGALRENDGIASVVGANITPYTLTLNHGVGIDVWACRATVGTHRR
jgi:hypothetical protein